MPATKEGLKKCYRYFSLSKYIHTTQTSHSIITSHCTRCFVYPEPSLSFSAHGQEREERELDHTLGHSSSNLTARKSRGVAFLLISPFLDSSPEILVQWSLGNVHFLTSLLGYADAGGPKIDLDLCTLEQYLYEGHTFPLRMITTSQATPGASLHWLQRIRVGGCMKA